MMYRGKSPQEQECNIKCYYSPQSNVHSLTFSKDKRTEKNYKIINRATMQAGLNICNSNASHAQPTTHDMGRRVNDKLIKRNKRNKKMRNLGKITQANSLTWA